MSKPGGVQEWLVRDGAGHLRIEVGHRPREERDVREESLRYLESLLWRGLTVREPEARRVLEPIYYALRGVPAPTAGGRAMHFERALADELRIATSSGWLRIVRIEAPREWARLLTTNPVDDRPAPPSARTRDPVVEPDTWIAIELVDEDGVPVPNVAYRIQTPDGQVREGMTNDQGRAREGGLYAGNCQVTFPDLHAPDWKKVG